MMLPLLLTAPRCPHLIGGGGKTTLLYALARAAVAAGHKVITTTTTHIMPPAAAASPAVLVAPAAPDCAAALARHRHITVADAVEPGSGKLRGSAALVERLAATAAADRIIVEADGAAGRPLKAHAGHEPVISAAADAIFAVVGTDAVNMPLCDSVVHRAALFAEQFALAAGTLLTPARIAAAILPPCGYASRVPEHVPVIVIITKVVTPMLYRQANELAELLLASERVTAVMTGDLLGGELAVRQR